MHLGGERFPPNCRRFSLLTKDKKICSTLLATTSRLKICPHAHEDPYNMKRLITISVHDCILFIDAAKRPHGGISRVNVVIYKLLKTSIPLLLKVILILLYH